jgi:hypothetical protein
MEMRHSEEITSILEKPKGARIVYHVGMLAQDRGGERGKTEPQRAVNETANIAWNLYEQGKITLCQRRIGPNLFEYIAERR